MANNNEDSAEQKAMKFVMKFEVSQGRKPENVSNTRSGYDIRSGDRKIEVKASSPNNPPFVNFNKYNFAALQREDNFWLYVVYNIKDKSKLLVLSKNEILQKAKLMPSWEISLRQADFKKHIED